MYRASGLLLLLLALVTFLSHVYIDYLGLAGVVSSFLVIVVLTSYYLRFPLGLIAAASAFLIINFFFIDPLYTWAVAEFASWVALLGFLLTSIVISTLIRKLQLQSEIADLARSRAEFSKALAEQIAASDSIELLLSASCKLIHQALNRPVAIAQIEAETCSIIHQAGVIQNPINKSAIIWAASNGKMIGPGTGNWTEFQYWIIPFERLPGKAPVLIIGDGDAEGERLTSDFRSMADQLSSAYHRLNNMELVRQAEFRAQEESIHNTLLASISHDMRTPLTCIIGATETFMNQMRDKLEPGHQSLLESVLTEAEHLANATENILSLVQLETHEAVPISLDWQSPEEIVGILMARYRARGQEHRLKPEVLDNSTLIRANATLLTQALMNLTENALAVQPQDSPVAIKVHRDGECVCISVIDQGPGFPEGFELSDIRKFGTTASKDQRGFGLGLAIALAVARKHHAELKIVANGSKGACVSFRFRADMDILQS